MFTVSELQIVLLSRQRQNFESGIGSSHTSDKGYGV